MTALRLKPKLLTMCWMMNGPYLYRFHFQLAGVVAVEVTGGPTIDFVPGRKVQICSSKFPIVQSY